jgi:hypothetical protein
MRSEVVHPDATDVGWFVARQPAVVQFFERRCGATDAFPVALDAAFQICRAVEARDGVPPPPVPANLLDRADDALEFEALAPAHGGCAERQPDLCAWVAELLDDPPLPLDPVDARRVGTCLVALIYALDELTTGRPVP